MTKSLVSELEYLANALEADSSTPTHESLPSLAERIAKYVGVRTDEVAILGVSNRWRHLHFLVPVALKNVGFIPLSSNSALAARTAREMKAEINNAFSAVRHASVFEGVKAATTSGESIHKIISVPILNDEKVVGVIQVSRKGMTALEAGADFTAEDMSKVQSLCKPLGKLVKHLAGE